MLLVDRNLTPSGLQWALRVLETPIVSLTVVHRALGHRHPSRTGFVVHELCAVCTALLLVRAGLNQSCRIAKPMCAFMLDARRGLGCARCLRESKLCDSCRDPDAEAHYAAAAAESTNAWRVHVPDGAQCYLCLDEGDLVRGCACRGTSGFSHLDCLVALADSKRVWGRDTFRRQSDCQVLTHCGVCKVPFSRTSAVALARAEWVHSAGRPEHSPVRIRAQKNLATILLNESSHMRMHYCEEAGSIFTDLLPLCQRVFGPTHDETIHSRETFAMLLKDQSDLAISIETFEEEDRQSCPKLLRALQILTDLQELKTRLGYPEAELLRNRSYIGNIQLGRGSLVEVEPVLRENLAASERLHGETSYEYLATAANLAKCLGLFCREGAADRTVDERQAKCREGATLRTRTLEQCLRKFGPMHNLTLGLQYQQEQLEEQQSFFVRDSDTERQEPTTESDIE